MGWRRRLQRHAGADRTRLTVRTCRSVSGTLRTRTVETWRDGRLRWVWWVRWCSPPVREAMTTRRAQRSPVPNPPRPPHCQPPPPNHDQPPPTATTEPPGPEFTYRHRSAGPATTCRTSRPTTWAASASGTATRSPKITCVRSPTSSCRDAVRRPASSGGVTTTDGSTRTSSTGRSNLYERAAIDFDNADPDLQSMVRGYAAGYNRYLADVGGDIVPGYCSRRARGSGRSTSTTWPPTTRRCPGAPASTRSGLHRHRHPACQSRDRDRRRRIGRCRRVGVGGARP